MNAYVYVRSISCPYISGSENTSKNETNVIMEEMNEYFCENDYNRIQNKSQHEKNIFHYNGVPFENNFINFLFFPE